MQDQFPIPSCFSPSDKFSDDPNSAKSGQSLVMSVYRTKIAGHCRIITITWCKNLLVHGLSISVEALDQNPNDDHNINHNNIDIDHKHLNQFSCKVELRPWYFWRKLGSKRFQVDGKPVDIFWDLRQAKFSGETEPRSDYYVAVVSDEEVVLLLGDLKKEAYRRTGFRPSIIDAILLSKKEHVFGKKRFSTRAKFHEKDKFHDILLECSNNGGFDSEMMIKIDGNSMVDVKHLQWKFRGNESISIGKTRLEVYWDVHDWLFVPGMRHALFIFKPVSSPACSSSTFSSSSSSMSSVVSLGEEGSNGSSGSCLFLYAWKLE
ncbi:uncharacterized protein LOC120270125 [Dioscorea cayenensis subsp. rotundata]|uniref:Uncharacterized protein LOC120270125 n=1 Tax=Dioscorea cayennensis subsp. rotundata TaxID=55577 RepID=A0AB40C2H0_DIOCR|nr:uncharacterized protein LOC120270125 [Dioscorea cayenensis subsp. rotundata]